MKLDAQSINRISRAVKSVEGSRRSLVGKSIAKTEYQIEIAQFEVIKEFDDYLSAFFVVDVEEDGSATDELDAEGNPIPQENIEPIYIAKPYLLRSKSFNTKKIAKLDYITQDQSTRKCTDDKETEETADDEVEYQTITPPYLPREPANGDVEKIPGEIITAIKIKTGLTVGTGEDAKSIDWCDLNTAGRCWALNEDYEPTEASIPGAAAIPDPAAIP